MTRKTRLTVAALLLVLIVVQVVSRMDRSTRADDWQTHFFASRTPLPPAATAAEWLARWDKDLATYNGNAAHHYAELPPITEWDALFEGLEQRLSLDDKTLAERLGPHASRKPDTLRRAYRFFIASLQGDAPAIESSYRELITRGGISHFGSGRVTELQSLSRDPEEALAWIRDRRPHWLEPAPVSVGNPTTSLTQDLLAVGKIPEAVERLWDDGHTNAVEQILTIARLTEDSATERRALDHLRKAAETANGDEFERRPWIRQLISEGRWQEIASLLKDSSADGDPHQSASGGWLGLALIRHLKGPQDYLKAFDEFVRKQAMDQSAVLDFLSESHFTHDDPAALHIDALVAANRRGEALPLALYLLATNRRDDNAYRRVQALDPAAFASFLDRLHTFDPFEERPLIWKAKLALQAGDPAAAKRWIDAAIALDPADGDQGRGSRMFAYEVLAEVHQALGDTEQAAFFREVVAAIRDGEIADAWRLAGMTSEATRRYQAALGRFSDAYCLQSRLALTLAEDNRFDEALPHFRKAFELMPISFGPRESHCFGCEGMFRDERIKPLARAVLAEFAARHPENPRAPYLLGLVLESMNLHDEAANAFQSALRLDPNYYHAAEQLLGSLEKLPTRFNERAGALATLARITPYPQLAQLFSRRTDLRQAWLDAANVPPSPLDLPPFPIPLPPPGTKPPGTHTHYFSLSHHTGAPALDGWSVEELCRENQLLRGFD